MLKLLYNWAGLISVPLLLMTCVYHYANPSDGLTFWELIIASAFSIGTGLFMSKIYSKKDLLEIKN